MMQEGAEAGERRDDQRESGGQVVAGAAVEPDAPRLRAMTRSRRA